MRVYLSLVPALLCLSSFVGAGPQDHLRFHHYPLEFGFAGNQPYDIFCDNQGLMWIGTEDGLNLFDGTNITVFRANPDNPNALKSSAIRQIAQDPSGDLWLATRGGGLHRMNYETQQFRAFQHDPEREDTLSSDNLYGMALSRDGRIWLGSHGGGLDRFDPKTEKTERIDLLALFPDLTRHPRVFTVMEDSKGFLYMGTWGQGVLRWHPETGETFRIPRKFEEDDEGIPNIVLSVTETRNGSIWIGTNGTGLFVLNPETLKVAPLSTEEHPFPAEKPYTVKQDKNGNFWIADHAVGLIFRDVETGAHYVHGYDPTRPFHLDNPALLSMEIDQRGHVWVGTQGSGVSWVDPNQKPFESFYVSGDSDTLLTANATAFDSQNRLWVGSRETGIYIGDPITCIFKPYDEVAGLPKLASAQVKSLAGLPGNYMAVGTWDNGLQIINLNDGTSRHIQADPDREDALTNPRVGDLLADGEQGLWIGGYNGGLSYLDRPDGTLKRMDKGEIGQRLSRTRITRIKKDHHGVLWMGSISAGVFRYDPETGEGARWHKQSPGAKSLRTDDVLDIYPDTDGKVWVIGRGTHLSRLNPATGEVDVWDFDEGIPSELYSNLLVGKDGRFWLTGLGHMVLFNPKTETVRVFDEDDGYRMAGSGEQASITSEDGTHFFFDGNGLLRIRPGEIPRAHAEPRVVLHDISLSVKSIARREGFPQPMVLREPLSKVPLHTKSLTLTHEQRLVGFQFSAIHYDRPDKIKYRYRLEGFDDAWFETTAKNPQAAFSNLDAGTYRFEVQATNEEGVWSPHTTALALTVLPPLWLTWWAKLIYGLIAIGLVSVYLIQQRGKLEGQRKIAEQQRELARQAQLNAEKDRALAEEARKVAARLEQLDKLKDEFLANTSHELRTPLQGIIGMAESLVDGAAGAPNARLTDSLRILINEGRRLSHLVNDILDFSQLRHQRLDLDIKAVDLRTTADLVVSLTQPRLRGSSVTLRNAVAEDCPMVAADEDRLQQIIHNLVGNAVKFTERGTITLDADVKDRDVVVTVRDTGIGIEPEKLDTIFNSFEQVDGSAARARGGTGLGLSITKALVDSHGGRLDVWSEPGTGSVFTFSLPMADKAAQLDATTLGVAPVLCEPEVIPAPATIDEPPEIELPEDCLHVLVVDDEPINRRVLQHHLESQGYRVTAVPDGRKALERLDDDIDLMLLDVMMPGMTGYEVARHVREDHALQDLPIIFLTAKTELADLVAAFQYGGNDFLAKPVAKEELLTRIRTQHQLLDLHRNLEDKVKLRTKQLAERTREVEGQHRELQNVYRILRTLNGLARLNEIFEALLYHGLQLFDTADRAALMVREGKMFRLAALVGHEPEEADNLIGTRLKWEQLVRRYVQSGEEVGEGIYRLDHLQDAVPLGNLNLERPSRSLVVLTLKIAASVEGFLVFSNVEQETAFSDVAVQRLARFKEHATAALTRARLLNEIEKQKEEIVRNQEIILRQEKLASLGTMTAGIAHEINNPNNFIAGGGDSLVEEIADFRGFLLTLLGDEPDQEYVAAFDQRFTRLDEQVGMIRLGSQRIGKIVGDLLRLTQLDDTTATGVNLYEIVVNARRAVGALYPDTTIELDLDETIKLSGQAEAFDHVFGHLLSNACDAIKKAAHGAGRVVISAADQPTRTLITVADNGCGITPEAQRKLFDAFYTTGEVGSGTGLGLFTSHQIIKGLGGEISVASQVGSGAVFSVSLPKQAGTVNQGADALNPVQSETV